MFFLWGFVAFVAYVWLVVTVWRASTLWGVITLLFPIAGALFILMNWGEDNGAKFPFAIWLVATGLYMYAAFNAVQTAMEDPEMQQAFQEGIAEAIAEDPEVQRRMAEDPEFRDQIEQMQRQFGGAGDPPAGSEAAEDFASFQDEGGEVEQVAPRAPASAAPVYSQNEQLAWRVAMSSLKRIEGGVDFSSQSAKLTLPQHFQFIDRKPLAVALASVRESIDKDVLGWIVHEAVPLEDRYNAWWIEVRALEQGHVALGDALEPDTKGWHDRAFEVASNEGKQSGKLLSFLGFPVEPWASQNESALAWVGSYGAGGEQVHLCHGMALGRERQIIYRMRAKYTPQWQELCFLSVRTLARKTRFDPDQTYADYTRFVDDRADFDAVDYIVGEARVGGTL